MLRASVRRASDAHFYLLGSMKDSKFIIQVVALIEAATEEAED